MLTKNRLHDSELDGVFLIEKILEKKQDKYHIKWQGYSTTTWEPRKTFLSLFVIILRELENLISQIQEFWIPAHVVRLVFNNFFMTSSTNDNVV